MRDIIRELNKYDDSLTVKELKIKIKNDSDLLKKNKKIHFKNIQNEFKNVYLKRHTENLFGAALELIYIQEITSYEYSDEYKLIYTFKGDKISFSSRDIYFKNIYGDNSYEKLSERELPKLEKITIEEYNEYLTKYNTISIMLNDLIK